MTTRLCDLVPDDAGRRVTVDGRVGILSWARVPGYTRIPVWAWYLIVETPGGPFEEAALSLQWADSREVVETA